MKVCVNLLDIQLAFQQLERQEASTELNCAGHSLKTCCIAITFYHVGEISPTYFKTHSVSPYLKKAYISDLRWNALLRLLEVGATSDAIIILTFFFL